MNLKDKLKGNSKNNNSVPSRARSGKSQSDPDSKDTLTINTSKQSEKNANLARLLEDHGARGKALAALMDALRATVGRYCPKSKVMYQEPDHRVRASAAVDILCFTDGKPIERREQVMINVDGNEEMQRKILESPSLRAALRSKIAEADSLRAGAIEMAGNQSEQNRGNGQP